VPVEPTFPHSLPDNLSSTPRNALPHKKLIIFTSTRQNIMSIKYISGDIFVNRYNAEALAHGCNCKGAMGAGIAKSVRESYPDMYQEYRRLCKSRPRQFNPGDSFLWKEEGKPHVFNLATQKDYWHNRATCEAIEKALETMKHQADEQGIKSIAMPRISAGYGGLSWDRVSYSRLSRPILAFYKVITVAFHKDFCSGASRGEAKHLNRFSKYTSTGVR